MTETHDAQPNHMSPKKLQAIISHLTAMVISCGLLMWSVFNLWLNVLAYRANEKPDQAWGTAAVMVFITCVVPFLIGLWLLFRTLGSPQNSQRGADGDS